MNDSPSNMPRKFRILIILAVAVVVGPLAIAVSLPDGEKIPTGRHAFQKIARWADDFAVGLGVKAYRSRCTAHNACIANLKQLDGAKATWAMENKRPESEVPAMTEIYGPASYIREAPLCPDGGRYVFGRVSQNPWCTFPGHTL